MVEEDGEVVEEEVVDGLPVVAESVVLEERWSALPAVPTVQAAALAATGFVCGAAPVAVVARHRTRKASKKRRRNPIGEIVSSNSFLIDVHLLRRD